MTLNSRTILLTGASGGIGSAIRACLQSKGYDVIAPDSSLLDLSDANSVSSWLHDNRMVVFHGVVLSAGINVPQILFADENQFLKIQKVNFESSYMLLSKLVPQMSEMGFGRVVAISSAYSNLARFGRSSYSISKASLETLIRSIAVEYGSKNVLANSVVPGFIDTPLTRKNNNEKQIEQILSRVPLGRLGRPEEIAHIVQFLLSPENTYITGQRINVDGGFSVN